MKKSINSSKPKITKHLDALKALKSLGPVKLNAVLPHLSKDLEQSVCECIHNVINNSDVMSDKSKKMLRSKLSPYKKKLNKIGKKHSKQRGSALSQAGGFPIATILGTAIPIIAQLLAKK